MDGKQTRHISSILILVLLFSCLFFLANTNCFLSIDTQSGPFCAAEQASAPVTHSVNDLHIVITTNDLFASVLPSIPLFFSLLILVLQDISGRLFHRRMKGQLTRYGPYQRQFLPYLMATHGM